MILKERTIPLKILVLQALLRRLPPNHAKNQQILDEVGRRLAGYQGEAGLDYYFRSLPDKKYMILHDLNLPDGDYNCQIDTLLLTPEFILIIDSKYMSGKLVLDTDNDQFIQYLNDKEKGYSYPIAQAERHQKYLKELLASNHFPDIPIVYLVVLSNNYCTYTVTGRNAYKVRPVVCKADIMLSRIEAYEKMYQASVLDWKQLRKLGKMLIKMNTPPIGYFLQKFGIEGSELLMGVQCPPPCNHMPMVRKKQQWYCPKCRNFSRDAHLSLLQDYFLLVDWKISNQEFRRVAQISSIHTATRLLLSSNLDFSGKTNMRFYFSKTNPFIVNDSRDKLKNTRDKVPNSRDKP